MNASNARARASEENIGRPWPAMRPWPLFNKMAAFLKKKKAAMRPRTVNFFKSGHVAGWPDGRWVTPILACHTD